MIFYALSDRLPVGTRHCRVLMSLLFTWPQVAVDLI